jgi:FkbM family methyltransferase
VVYAFEPDASVAVHRYGILGNLVIIPMAVSDQDGFQEFHINSNKHTSSLLPLNPGSLGGWRGALNLHTEKRVLVPVIRLDTFLDSLGITEVDYLKIDAQGHDMEVMESLGGRLRNVRELKVEALTARDSLYQGAHNRAEKIAAYLLEHGFRLVQSSPQSLDQETNLLFRRTDDVAMSTAPQSESQASK